MANNEKIGIQPSSFRWLLALSIFAFALSIYGETEGQWFNSYVRNIAGMEYSYVSYMVSASGIIGAVMYIIWGTYSDNLRTRFGRRIPLLVIGVLSTSFLMISFTLTTQYWWLLVCDGILMAITSNMYHMANKALVPDLFRAERRGYVNTILSIAGGLGTAAIWAIAFMALPKEETSYTKEMHASIITGSAILLMGAGLIAGLLIREPPVAEPPKNWVKDLVDIFNYKEMSKPNVRDFLKLFVASLFFIMSTNAYRPFLLIVVQEIKFSPEELTAGIIIIAGATVFALAITGRACDTIGRRKTSLTFLIIAAFGCACLGQSNGTYALGLIGLAIMFPAMVAMPIAINTWTQDLLPEESRGRFLGIINIGSAAGQAPGALLAGFIADNFGIYAIFYISALFLVISLPFFIRVPETLPKSIA